MRRGGHDVQVHEVEEVESAEGEGERRKERGGAGKVPTPHEEVGTDQQEDVAAQELEVEGGCERNETVEQGDQGVEEGQLALTVQVEAGVLVRESHAEAIAVCSATS